MKKLILLLLFLFPAIAQAQPPLTVEGNQVFSGGKPVTLRGVSLCSLEWHTPLQQIAQVTDSPAQWNVNILRLPVQVKEWDRVGADAYIKNYLDPAVEMCKKNDVYCIIDWHEIADWDKQDVRDKLENFWKLVAKRYADEPNILYEIFNEPAEPKARNAENWAKWRDVMQEWVDQIRKDAPDTVLLIGSPHWSQMPGFAIDNPVKGDNLIYTLHLYPLWNHKEWDNLLGDPSKKLPILISEWGWSNDPETWYGIKGSQESFGDPLKNYLKDKPTVGWTAWSYDPLCGPAMLGEAKEMAAFVKQWLKEANP